MPSFKQAEPKLCGPRGEVPLQGTLWLWHSYLFQLQSFSWAFMVEETPAFPFPSGTDDLFPLSHKLPEACEASCYLACSSRARTLVLWLSPFYCALSSLFLFLTLSPASAKGHTPLSQACSTFSHLGMPHPPSRSQGFLILHLIPPFLGDQQPTVLFLLIASVHPSLFPFRMQPPTGSSS